MYKEGTKVGNYTTNTATLPAMAPAEQANYWVRGVNSSGKETDDSNKVKLVAPIPAPSIAPVLSYAQTANNGPAMTTTNYEDHFDLNSRNRLFAISKSGRSMQSEDVQNFLHAKERGIRVELFVRKNKDDRISKEFYYLGHMTASGNAREFTMSNTDKSSG